ncbi:hypothetical protein Aperf_G00000101648 [Anoplocephala perfoliata]
MASSGKGLQIGLSWVPLHQHEVPRNAIEVDKGVYVARAFFAGEWVPGKYVAGSSYCYIPHGGKEHAVNECEILCDTSVPGGTCCYEWKDAEGGAVPENAVFAGKAKDGAPLFVCKGSVDNEACAGKVHLGHTCAYMPHSGKECGVNSYNVLCLKKDGG